MNKPCTNSEEKDYFKQTLDIQVQLLKEGKIDGLELFPGYFGKEATLYPPTRSDLTCKDSQRCTQNTIFMRDSILAKRNAFSGASSH